MHAKCFVWYFFVISDDSVHFPSFVCAGNELNQTKELLLFIHSKLTDSALDNICNHPKDNNWNFTNELDIENAYYVLIKIINGTLDIAPERNVTIPYNKIIKEPWFVKGIFKSRSTLNKLYRKKTKQPPNHPSHSYRI